MQDCNELLIEKSCMQSISPTRGYCGSAEERAATHAWLLYSPPKAATLATWKRKNRDASLRKTYQTVPDWRYVESDRVHGLMQEHPGGGGSRDCLRIKSRGEWPECLFYTLCQV